MSDSKDKTGYKRPPIGSQFKKGQSGNPNGRPKGRQNFKTDLKATLARPVQVTEGGRPRSISTQQASLERLREKALKGDPRALDRLLALAERHAEEETAAIAEAKLSEMETAVLADYEARLREKIRNEIQSKLRADGPTTVSEADTARPTPPSEQTTDAP
jgi:hypothetical protein